MRNQFGGHAVTRGPKGGDAGARRRAVERQAGRRRRRPRGRRELGCLARRAPDPAQLPLLRRPRRRAGAGGHGVHRPQRPGQDQPRRGDRLPLPPVLAPGRHRRAARQGRRRPGDHPGGRRRRTAGRPCSRSSSTRAGPTGRGSTVAAAAAARPHRPGPHGRLRARRPDPGQGRPVGPAQVPRRPARPAHPAARRGPVRLRPDPQAAQQPAQDRRRARAARSARRGVSHPGGLGRATSPASAPSCSRRGCAWSTTCAPTSARPTRLSPAGRRATTPTSTTRRSLRARRPTGRGLAGRAARRGRSRRGARTSSTAASRWSARTATSCCSPSATATSGCRSRATPRTGSRGRSRWRCGWRRTTCSAPTATTRSWCSTTSSPSSTPSAAASSPQLVAGAEQVLVTAAVAADVPDVAAGDALRGRRRGGDP